jgi:enamine deaminase RidA (YjgF/YER057c/UK114 family)
MQRQRVSTGTYFEQTFGYSRAVRVGRWVAVAGTTAMGPDGPVGGASMAAQTAEVLRRISHALAEVGASMDDVIRTRVFVSDITLWQEVGKVHREAFGAVLPVSTLVEANLIDPRLMVEIEVDAIVSAPGETHAV